VFAPVAHRQYVFTLPKLLRPIFSRQRAWLASCAVSRAPVDQRIRRGSPRCAAWSALFVAELRDLATSTLTSMCSPPGVFGADATFIACSPVPEALAAAQVHPLRAHQLAHLGKSPMGPSGELKEEVGEFSRGAGRSEVRHTSRAPPRRD